MPNALPLVISLARAEFRDRRTEEKTHGTDCTQWVEKLHFPGKRTATNDWVKASGAEGDPATVPDSRLWDGS